MIAADNNAIVRLLTHDDERQYKRAFSLFSSKLGSVTSWVGLCLCLVTGSVWGQSMSDLEAEENKLQIQWLNQFPSYLETSEHAQFRTISGIHLLQSGDPEAAERGVELIDEALSMPNPDPVSLWLVASNCRFRELAHWCDIDRVYAMLVQADPGNAATLMLRFSQTSFASDELLDSEANRQLLLKAAQADRFDMYWGRGADKLYADALKFAEIKSLPPIPELSPSNSQFDISANTYAYYTALTWLMAKTTTVAYNNTVELCRIHSRNQRSETTKACKKLARILRNSGKSTVTRQIGFAIEKAMLKEVDPGDPRIRHLQLIGQTFSVVQFCLAPRWHLHIELLPEAGVAALLNWAKNLDALGEWEGNKLTSIQEYSVSPDDYAVNPANCEKLLDLDDEAMVRLVDGQSPYAAWEKIQAEVGSHKLN